MAAIETGTQGFDSATQTSVHGVHGEPLAVRDGPRRLVFEETEDYGRPVGFVELQDALDDLAAELGALESLLGRRGVLFGSGGGMFASPSTVFIAEAIGDEIPEDAREPRAR